MPPPECRRRKADQIICRHRSRSASAARKGIQCRNSYIRTLPRMTMRTTITVGRWRCRTEYARMLVSGKVQESVSGTTYVLRPPDPSSFLRQAKAGDMYVEFDVPADCLIPMGVGWPRLRDRIHYRGGTPPAADGRCRKCQRRTISVTLPPNARRIIAMLDTFCRWAQQAIAELPAGIEARLTVSAP